MNDLRVYINNDCKNYFFNYKILYVYYKKKKGFTNPLYFDIFFY